MQVFAYPVVGFYLCVCIFLFTPSPCFNDLGQRLLE